MIKYEDTTLAKRFATNNDWMNVLKQNNSRGQLPLHLVGQLRDHRRNEEENPQILEIIKLVCPNYKSGYDLPLYYLKAKDPNASVVPGILSSGDFILTVKTIQGAESR